MIKLVPCNKYKPPHSSLLSTVYTLQQFIPFFLSFISDSVYYTVTPLFFHSDTLTQNFCHWASDNNISVGIYTVINFLFIWKAAISLYLEHARLTTIYFTFFPLPFILINSSSYKMLRRSVYN